MTWVFNRNLLKPRYAFIWNIEKVLKFVKGMPIDTEHSDKHINLKLVKFVILILNS